MWFTMGFGLVCAFCACFWTTEGLILPALGFLGLFGAFLVGGRRFRKLKIVATVCLGCALGLAWFQGYHAGYLSHATNLEGQLASVTARCTDYSYETDFGSAVETLLYLDGKPVRAKLYLNNPVPAEPGDVIKGVFAGHHHSDFHLDILATMPDGTPAVIPQYIHNATAYHNGHLMRIFLR